MRSHFLSNLCYFSHYSRYWKFSGGYDSYSPQCFQTPGGGDNLFYTQYNMLNVYLRDVQKSKYNVITKYIINSACLLGFLITKRIKLEWGFRKEIGIFCVKKEENLFQHYVTWLVKAEYIHVKGFALKVFGRN